ncbi:uncharacterized protein SPSK_01011 [Sporothrix schenckii 1099-18]|uniref:Aminopeptidase n=2 Tax=Sporothrix schenckii TaxID=29908 RepID=U7PNR5_SPOS1|nr:uncharacterized protein SPSK_01011 [Sporothrix schenckii 1099-18]ERS96566.1 hypothetical protein HMPREF1624_06772 [Sporothrix schenckii ATCC 58251]KJR81245.1 hypothetical protein SPSK_01011 [Sporothrix schenckii 1099-18]
MASDRDILPGNFKPSHYDLTITDLDFTEWTFKGTVTINGALTELTSEVVLNTLELDIASATLEAQATKGTRSEKAVGIAYNAKSQRATLTFVQPGAEAFPPSAKASLYIAFTGKLNHDLAGFYRSQYTPPADAPQAAASTPRDNDFHYMLSTQFESCDARRAFPCFDEPNLKATFDFAIEIPDDLVALSNMPIKDEGTSAATASTPAGKKIVRFERTPIMSTYLLAWAVGDFEYIEALTDRRYDGKQIPVRVYTTRGLKEQGRWALEHAPKYIDFFSERFGIDYPLPKSDILAAHEFTHGAMENWGLVTYRTTAILFDEQLSEGRFRNRIAYVVAHELAHQWFGNLVTMDWWDELWLNEGFATWAGWLATDALHPDWDVWAQFVNEGMERALKLDSLRASHPIQVPVRDALDVNQVFDAISYLKGCSVIRMLANHLGTDVFLQGVSAYLKKHKYGNAKTTALWDALSEASGDDVNTLMSSWIEKIGFPVVAVTEGADGQLAIKQSRFLSTGDVMPEDDGTTWWIPLGLTGRVGSAEGSVESLALTKKEDVISNISKDFYKLNTDSTGFYRVNYPPERLAKLGSQLDRLSASDKILIAGSAAELAFAGYAKTPALLSFLEGFGNESHVRVLSQALDAIGVISSVFGDDETINKGLKAFTLKLIDKPLAEFSLNFPENEEFTKAQLRKRLLTSAVRSEHPSLNKQAIELFQAYIADPVKNPLQGDLRTPVFLAAIIDSAEKAAPLLLKEWKTTVAPDGKEVALLALGASDDEKVVQDKLLPFLFGDGADTVVGADVHILANGMAARTHARPLLWKYIQKEWAGTVERKLAGNPILLDRFVKVALSQFSDTSSLQEIDTFFADKNTKAFDRTLETVKDTIRGRAAYRTRDSEELKNWLVAHGYTS